MRSLLRKQSPQHAQHLAADASLVLSVASRIERDPVQVHAWYVEDRIACLGNFTAARLVREGRGMLVVRFLLRAARQEGCMPMSQGDSVVDMTTRSRRAPAT